MQAFCVAALRHGLWVGSMVQGSPHMADCVLCACRGELVSNCRSLDGSSQLQCFVQGLEVVQDCADTRNYPTELAPAMLAAGRGTDGQEGSLCTAVLAGPDAAANKRTPCLRAHRLL